MNTTKHCLILLVGAIALCACNQASLKTTAFPEWPEEEVYTYDTFNIKCVPQAISVKAAVQRGKELPSKGTTSERVYVKGIVKGFNEPKHTEGMTGYHNALVYIQDNTDTDLEYYGYQIYGIDSTKFESLDQLQIGDTIVIYGKLYNYNGTIETEAKGYAYMYYSSNDLAYPEGDFDYYKEGFQTSLGDWTQLVVDTPGVTVWKHNKTASGVTSAIAQAVGATASVKLKSEVWLVSPEIDLAIFNAKNVKLYFSTYFHGNATAGTVAPTAQESFRLKVRKEGQEWTDITIPHFNSGRMPSYVNDTIDISAYVGEKTQIAFAYKSTTDFAPKWSISNIRISERKRDKHCY